MCIQLSGPFRIDARIRSHVAGFTVLVIILLTLAPPGDDLSYSSSPINDIPVEGGREGEEGGRLSVCERERLRGTALGDQNRQVS